MVIRVEGVNDLCLIGGVAIIGDGEYQFEEATFPVVKACLSGFTECDDGVWRRIVADTFVNVSVDDFIKSLATTSMPDSSYGALKAKRDHLQSAINKINAQMAAYEAANGVENVKSLIESIDESESLISYEIVKSQSSGLFFLKTSTMPIVTNNGHDIGSLLVEICMTDCDSLIASGGDVSEAIRVFNPAGKVEFNGRKYEAPHVASGGRICLGSYYEQFELDAKARDYRGMAEIAVACISSPNLSDDWGLSSTAWPLEA